MEDIKQIAERIQLEAAQAQVQIAEVGYSLDRLEQLDQDINYCLSLISDITEKLNDHIRKCGVQS